MMALIHDDVAIVSNEIFNGTFTAEALNYGNIHHASALVLSSPDLPNAFCWHIEERCQSLAPLIHQPASMYQEKARRRELHPGSIGMIQIVVTACARRIATSR